MYLLKVGLDGSFSCLRVSVCGGDCDVVGVDCDVCVWVVGSGDVCGVDVE